MPQFFILLLCLAVAAAGSTLNPVSGVLDNPVIQNGVTVGNGTQDQAGPAVAPVATLCELQLRSPSDTCLCHADCTYAHNTYGGTCETVPGKGLTCNCFPNQTVAEAHNSSANFQTTCKYATSYQAYVQEFVAASLVYFKQFFDLCPLNYVGYTNACSLDCIHDHAAVNGSCVREPPVSNLTFADGTCPKTFCKCSYS